MTIRRFLSTVAAGATIVLVIMASYIQGPSAAGTLFTSTASATVANTVTETTLIGTGTGSLTLPANFWTAGKSIRIVASGVYSTGATPGTLRIRLKLGSTLVGDSGADTPAASQTNRFWRVDALISCRTTGATGTVIVQTAFENNTSLTGVQFWGMPNAAAITIDTTAAQVVDLTAQWGTAAASETITGTNFAMAGYDAGTGGGGGGGGNTTSTGTFAAKPATCTSGDVYFPNNSFYLLRCGASNNWVPWGPFYPMIDPELQTYAWVNQGSATVSSTNGGILLSAPSNGNVNSLRIRTITAPATPYTFTVGFLPSLNQDNLFWHVGFRASGTGALATISWVMGTGANANQFGYRVMKWTNATTFSADYVGFTRIDLAIPSPYWLRVADDGTNRISSISLDGVNFTQIHSVTRTDFLTADQVLFALDPVNAAAHMNILSVRLE